MPLPQPYLATLLILVTVFPVSGLALVSLNSWRSAQFKDAGESNSSLRSPDKSAWVLSIIGCFSGVFVLLALPVVFPLAIFQIITSRRRNKPPMHRIYPRLALYNASYAALSIIAFSGWFFWYFESFATPEGRANFLSMDSRIGTAGFLFHIGWVVSLMLMAALLLLYLGQVGLKRSDATFMERQRDRVARCIGIIFMVGATLVLIYGAGETLHRATLNYIPSG